MFQAVGLDRSIFLKEENLRKMFVTVDRDEDGFFNKQDLIEAFKAFGMSSDEVSDKSWSVIFGQGDLNKDGRIDYQEFKRAMLDDSFAQV